MKLHGSLPSPYVRRIRLYLASIEQDFEFVGVNIYDADERADYASVTPVRKLPVLVDGDLTVMDSRVIYQYLRDKQARRLKQEVLPVSVAEHNLITVVDAVTDSFIVCFMAKNSGIEPSRDKMVYDMQYGRIESTLAWLDVNVGQYQDWAYPAMALASLLDWIDFRELYSLADYPQLQAFLADSRRRDDMQATDPRA